MWRFSKQFVFVFTIVCLLHSCGNSKENGYQNIAKTKTTKPKFDEELQAWFKVYRPDIGEINLFTSIDGSNLLGTFEENGIKIGRFKVQLNIRRFAIGGEVYCDTSIEARINLDSTWIKELEISIPPDQDIYIEFTLTDLNKNVYNTIERHFYNSEEWLPEDVKTIGVKNESPASNLALTDQVKLISNKFQKDTFLLISYTNLNQGILLPFKRNIPVKLTADTFNLELSGIEDSIRSGGYFSKIQTT